MPTHYDILGVQQDATTETIRRAFRREAKRLHPDKDSGTEADMVRLNEAYDTLKDPDRRSEYDQTLNRTAYRLPRRPAPTGPVPLDPFEFKLRVFAPLDRGLTVALSFLEAAIEELAYDIYDDTYIERFSRAVQLTEDALAEAHRRLFSAEWPGSLASALNLYRQGVHQVDDAIEDFNTFTLNFDSDLLVEGRALLRLADKMLDEAREFLGAVA